MPLIDVGIGAGVSGSNSEDDAGAGATGSRRRGVESGCVTDGRAVGAAGSFENAAKVKSKRYSG